MLLYEEQVVENDVFKQTEKEIKTFCKSRQTNTPLSTILDFTWSDVFDYQNCSLDKFEDVNHGIHAKSKCLKINGFPDGFYFVPGALSIQDQLDWAKKSLECYSEAEHTNLSNLKNLQGGDSMGCTELNVTSPVTCWLNADSSNSFKSFLKLRWSCLGYHYDWTARMYRRNLKSVFPEELSILCKTIVHNIKKSELDLDPEAAIVNYYPLSSSMGGHLDDAEHTMEKPIVSISLGCSAIFLLGGRDRTVKPLPILLRSGDALIMSGESRFCYHGVPAILSPDFDPDQAVSVRKYKHQKVEKNVDVSQKLKLTNVGELLNHFDSTDVEMKKVVDFLNVARININVRQVRVDTSDDSIWNDKAGTGAQKNKDVH